MSADAITMADERRSRWIPWAFVAFFGVVLAANAVLIVIAITTWPGLETPQSPTSAGSPTTRRWGRLRPRRRSAGGSSSRSSRPGSAPARSTPRPRRPVRQHAAGRRGAGGVRAPDPWRLRPGGRRAAPLRRPLSRTTSRSRSRASGRCACTSSRRAASTGCASASISSHDHAQSRPGWPGHRRQTPRRSMPPPTCEAPEKGGTTLHLMVEGVHCGGCVRRIEQALLADPAVEHARVNLTTRRLVVDLARAAPRSPTAWLQTVSALGYRVIPYDPAQLVSAEAATERALLRAMAVAGLRRRQHHAAVGRGLGRPFPGHGRRRRANLLHWFSALIALPAIALCRPAVLRLGAARAAQPAHQHGRADLGRRSAGERHEPVRDRARRSARLLRFRESCCCSSCWSAATSTGARADARAPPRSVCSRSARAR